MQKKSLGFTLSLLVVFFMSTFSINLDISQFIQREEINIPNWYFFLILGIDAIMVSSLILIYFYRKIGVYAFPVAVFLHFFFHNFYLSTFLYFDIFTIFLYFSLVLLATIPRWNSFK